MTVTPLTEVRDKGQHLVFGENVLSSVSNVLTKRLKLMFLVYHTLGSQKKAIVKLQAIFMGAILRKEMIREIRDYKGPKCFLKLGVMAAALILSSLDPHFLLLSLLKLTEL